LAARVDRLLTAAVAGDPHVTLNVKASELLADAPAVAAAISKALERAGPGITVQLRVSQTLSAGALGDELLNALANPDPNVRIASAPGESGKESVARLLVDIDAFFGAERNSGDSVSHLHGHKFGVHQHLHSEPPA